MEAYSLMSRHRCRRQVTGQNSFTCADLRFRAHYAALRHSLIRPPRTCLRSIRAVIPTAGTARRGGSWCRHQEMLVVSTVYHPEDPEEYA
jgi:hypothetical protein